MDENKTVNISLSKALLDAIDKQAQTEFRNRSDLIREAVRTYITSKGGMDDNYKLSTAEKNRIKGAQSFANLKEEPAILLSCVTRPQPNSNEDIFTSGSKTIKLMEDPPRLRRMGWDLQTLNQARLIEGEYLEVTNGERKLLKVYRDGQHVFAAGMDFFGHGVNKDEVERVNLNLLAVAELITNFVIFSRQISDELQKESTAFIFTLTIVNPLDKPVNLMAGRYGTDKIGELGLAWAERDIVIVNPGAVSDMRMAYQIYAELNYFFGVRTDHFWYADSKKQEMNKEDFVKQS